MTMREFVVNLFDSMSVIPDDPYLTMAAGWEDLRNFIADGWDIPKPFDVDEYVTEWNTLMMERGY